MYMYTMNVCLAGFISGGWGVFVPHLISLNFRMCKYGAPLFPPQSNIKKDGATQCI